MTDVMSEAAATVEETPRSVPQHVAIIMDGNGRWAAKRNLPRLRGHRAGTENIRRVIATFAEHDVKYLTLYAFSTENWGRPDDEVQGLMDIIAEVIDRETDQLDKNGARLVHIGREEGLSEYLVSKVRDAVERTRHNSRITVNVAFNYGGRAEIVDAVRRMVADGLSADEISEETMSRYLYTVDAPDPDLVIRTAGEMRLSNFLIWQAAYSEYYSTPEFWPDFGREEIEAALQAYAQRERRFGGLTPV
jgi:undecaprenyl diphosphate synthase